ncbi:MAG: pyrroline-5-carboxylate reductase [candidate division WS1 bacterium]|nr:pyrroline-5-carboxylate reductase [candidate division WS1 bacterium]
MDNSTPYQLAVVGCGAMGTGLIRALVEPDTPHSAADIIAADTEPSRRVAVEQLGVAVTDDAAEAVQQAEVILLAVKPQVLSQLLLELVPILRTRLLISIAAGVPLSQYEAALGPQASVVRVMPNILCTVGAAASAYCANSACSSEQIEYVADLLNAIGTSVAVAEELMDAVTGLSGSGPAFVAIFIEALIDGGVAAGLAREQATDLATQTVLGTARWLQLQGGSPSALKDMVTSPAGTTIAGIKALEERGLRAAVMEAVAAAARRSRELGS